MTRSRIASGAARAESSTHRGSSVAGSGVTCCATALASGFKEKLDTFVRWINTFIGPRFKNISVERN